MTVPVNLFSGRTALVTGAARRLGRATSLALAEQGADVVLHYHRSADDAAELAELIRDRGRQAWLVCADLTNDHDVSSLVDRATEQAGHLDILINNASVFRTDRITETDADTFWENIQIHAYAPLILSRDMARQAHSGHIVNFLDCRITDYDAEHAAYHLSKRMLFTLTRMLALELAPRVAVNAVAPGLILPPEGEDEDYLRQLASTNPMQRHGSAQSITDAVLYLLCSDFVTGQIIFVDGGRHMKGRVYG